MFLLWDEHWKVFPEQVQQVGQVDWDHGDGVEAKVGSTAELPRPGKHQRSSYKTTT